MSARKKDKFVESANRIVNMCESIESSEGGRFTLELKRQDVAHILRQTVAKDATLEHVANAINANRTSCYNAYIDGDRLVVHPQLPIVNYEEGLRHLKEDEEESN